MLVNIQKMKKLTLHLLLIGLCSIAVCANGQSHSSKKILIVYLSRTNNTKAVAEIIHSHVGGKLVALELQNPYPANYRQQVDQVVRENEKLVFCLL